MNIRAQIRVQTESVSTQTHHYSALRRLKTRSDEQYKIVMSGFAEIEDLLFEALHLGRVLAHIGLDLLDSDVAVPIGFVDDAESASTDLLLASDLLVRDAELLEVLGRVAAVHGDRLSCGEVRVGVVVMAAAAAAVAAAHTACSAAVVRASCAVDARCCCA